jgi:hypothetical protein
MDISVIGIETSDLSGFMYDEKYKNAFFLYCDVEEYCYSCDDENGFKKVRSYNNYWFRRCIGIPVCSRIDGCYKNGLNTYNRQLIDNSFKTAIESIKKYGFDTVYYSVSNQTDHLNDTIRVLEEHPFVHPSIIQYIMNKIKSVTTRNIQVMIRKPRANTI